MLKKYEHLFLWFTMVLFYFYQYILRILPNIIIDDLMNTFHMTANEFATLGAFSLYVYSFAQVPIGVVADRIGVKKIALYSLLLCIFSSYMFVNTDKFVVLQISRILTGLGSACGFLCALKIITDMFPKEQVGLFTGLTVSLGCLGAILAGGPLAVLISKVGVKSSVYYASTIGWIAFASILYSIFSSKDSSSKPKQEFSMQELKANIISALKSKMVWVFGIISIGAYTPISVLADLWGTGFFMTKSLLPKEQSALCITILYIGMLIGNVAIPALFSKKIRMSLIILPSILMVFFSLVLFSDMGVLTLYPTLLIVGILCASQIFCFTGAMSCSNAQNSGIVIGLINTINSIGAAVSQQLVGGLMDFQWNGKLDAYGVRFYSPENYSFALSSLLVLIALGVVLTVKYVGKNNKA